MKKIFLFKKYFFILLILLGFFCLNQQRAEAKSIKQPNSALIGSYALSTENGRQCAIKNSNKKLPIASLTKMMAALVFLENRQKDWDKLIIYNPVKHFVYGNYLHLKKGDQISIKDLFYSMLVGSVNESAKMLVEATGLSNKKFVALMNQKAKDLGMKSTRYVDQSGFSPDNISSASDQIRVLQKVFENFELRDILDTSVYDFETVSAKGKIMPHHIKHTNSLIGTEDFEILASKTGYLDEARNCLAMVIQKNGQVYFVVTLNDPSRYRDFSNTKNLIEKYAKNIP